MKTKLLFLFVLFSLTLSSQETPKEQIKKLANEIETLVKQEKEALKIAIETIDVQQKKGELTAQNAGELKAKKAEESANRIEKLVNERSNEINTLTQLIVKEALEGKIDTLADSSPTKEESTAKVNIRISNDKNTDNKRTVNRFIFAFGLNNVLQDNKISSLDDSPYSIWHSNFVELGWGYKTALDQENKWANVFYGISLQWNELKLFDNLYHINTDGQTLIVEHPENLKKSKLRNTQIIVPLGFEFDFSKKEITEGKTYYHRNQGVRLGLGGYAGLRVNTKQIIKYEAPRDHKKDKISSDYNINNLTYGLSGYLGYKDTSLYLKYDLHPLFKNTQTTNISLGVKFDL